MNVNRIIQVHDGDTLGALRSFLNAWWRRNDMRVLLAPAELPHQSGIAVEVIEDPARLARVNPCAPVMHVNSASAVAQLALDYPAGRAAAMLRPCELRTWVELQKRGRAPKNGVTIIGVDCLATFAPDEYNRQVAQYGASEVLRQALAYAAEGGLAPQRFRTACRVCDWPAPRGADVAIGALGVPPHEHLLIIARDQETDERLHLREVTHGLAAEPLVVQREAAVGAVAEKRARTRAHLIDTAPERFGDLGNVLSWFAACTLCGDCLDACPLYHGELSGMLGVRAAHSGGRPLLAELVEVGRWLASCSGCGMCEEACGNHVPLSLLCASLSHRIREQLSYRAGDPAQKLPWAA